MSAWRDEAGTTFNPTPSVSVLQIARDQVCVVVDDALIRPEGLIEWAAERTFDLPTGYAYPGLILEGPEKLSQRAADQFTQHARRLLGARRTLEFFVRLSLATLPPELLAPVQWQCHRDRLAAEPDRVLYAAMVLYLFRNPALGGTSFYMPRQAAIETDRMIADSQTLGPDEFRARYNLHPGYMVGSNAYFDRVAQVPAAWNRMIFYDGGLFHSADIDEPILLSADPRLGRLTLNGFFACSRNAQ
ncbi:MAG: DUF6445 family protein [Gammaproteobacteria bacterium]